MKAPILGEVKTRLIPYLSSTEAADLYKFFVQDTLISVSRINTPHKTWVAYQQHSKYPDLQWTGIKNPPEIFKQEGRSLGEKLTHAVGYAFGKGAQRVVIVGSDSPNLPRNHVDQAFSALDQSDVVVGPSLDGGYYLLGLSRPCFKLFDDVSWSTDQVFERTSQNARKMGYSLKVLPFHYDIDTIDDLKKLHDDLQSPETPATHTKKFLIPLFRQKNLLTPA